MQKLQLSDPDLKLQGRNQDHDGFEREIQEDDKDLTEDPEPEDSEEETGTQDDDDVGSEDAEDD